MAVSARPKLLIAKDAPSEGFGKLWELGRLDLTAEASILKPQSVSLFTDEEKNKARQRLAAAGWKSLPE